MKEKNYFFEKFNMESLILFLAVVFYLICRVGFMRIYNFHQTDEDQVVMWLGTVLFTHGQVCEPMWLGQNYGSMLESLLAVPLYWCKVPLHIALPISSFFIGISPFLILIVLCIKEKRYNVGWWILAVLLLFSVDMDVLTSVPRTFIPGYCFTVSGILICIKSSKQRWKILGGGVLVAVGIVMSETAICIAMPMVVYILYEHKNLKKYLWAFIGIAIGILYGKFSLLFYEINSEYLVWPKPKLSFDFKLLLERINQFPLYFRDLIIFRNAWIFLVFCLLFFIYLVVTRNISTSLIVLSTLGGIFLTLGFSKMSLDDTVLWASSRMLLFVPYNIVLAIYFSNIENCMMKKMYLKNRVAALIIMIVCVVMSAFWKYCDFKNRENEFKTSNYHVIMSVEALKVRAENAYNLMIKNSYDFAIVPHSIFSNALIALYDNDITAWASGGIDRNTCIFLREKERVRENVLWLSYGDGEDWNVDIVNTGNRNIIQFLYEDYGIIRTRYYNSWDGISN